MTENQERPDEAEAERKLGYHFLGERDFEEAKRHFERAIELGSSMSAKRGLAHAQLLASGQKGYDGQPGYAGPGPNFNAGGEPLEMAVLVLVECDTGISLLELTTARLVARFFEPYESDFPYKIMETFSGRYKLYGCDDEWEVYDKEIDANIRFRRVSDAEVFTAFSETSTYDRRWST